jgi:hypothetical protein
MRRCSSCKESKEINEFCKNRSRKDGRQSYCKSCAKIQSALYRVKVPGYQRRWKLKHKYGISEEDYKSMLEKQGGACSICFKEGPLHVDHDHFTGKVRDLLCSGCNSGLGYFKENPYTLLNAIQYIKEHNNGID